MDVDVGLLAASDKNGGFGKHAAADTLRNHQPVCRLHIVVTMVATERPTIWQSAKGQTPGGRCRWLDRRLLVQRDNVRCSASRLLRDLQQQSGEVQGEGQLRTREQFH